MCKRPDKYCKAHIRNVEYWCNECQEDSGVNMYTHPNCGCGCGYEEQLKAERAEAALDTLRNAWNAHMATCPQHASLPAFMQPSPEDIQRWLEAPSDTASARPVRAVLSSAVARAALSAAEEVE